MGLRRALPRPSPLPPVSREDERRREKTRERERERERETHRERRIDGVVYGCTSLQVPLLTSHLFMATRVRSAPAVPLLAAMDCGASGE